MFIYSQYLLKYTYLFFCIFSFTSINQLILFKFILKQNKYALMFSTIRRGKQSWMYFYSGAQITSQVT